MADRRVVDLLTALPLGERIWLASAGLSMWPFILSGDSLRVLRCAEPDLAVGDVAVVLYDPDVLVAHLVTSTSPFQTSSSVGTPDAPGATVLGRVVELRRGPLRLRIPRRVRHLLRLAPTAAQLLRRLPLARRLVNHLR